MKILYLTPAWYGFDKIIYSGETEITGLPSFCYPLKELAEQGNSIDMVIIYTDYERDLNIKASWFDNIKIVSQFKYELAIPKKLISIFRFRRYINGLLKNNDYDFVYVHGSSPSVANGIVKKFRIPIGQRLYGTFLWDKIKNHGVLHTKIKHIVEYLSFSTSKKFLLATDDGSGADKVVKAIFNHRQPPYDFYYWKNGVSRIAIDDAYESTFLARVDVSSPYIFYCARFDAWKRQDRVIKILKTLKDQSVFVKVVFAGPFDTLGDEYYTSVISLAEQLGVLDQCVFLGSICKQDIFLYNKYALASLSLYDVCNVTSVFHEMMASGALIIVRDDDDVREYINDGVEGFLVKDDDRCVDLIKEIYSSPEKFRFMRDAVRNISNQQTLSWEERAQKEVNLIKTFVENKQD